MKMQLKKRNQKGFTLVEIIVVLVILAILAAVLIPTMLGFVDDSRGKAEIANARAAYLAAQMIATEMYAGGTTTPATIAGEINGLIGKTTTDRMDKLVGADLSGATVSGTVVSAAGKVESLSFTNNGYTVTITGGSGTTVVKN